MKRLVDIKRDDGITLDKMGIDYLMVDEAHEFKNLYVYSQMSNIAGVPQVKSEKASDMFMKTQFISEAGGGVCFATGTPISNTMAELYTMQRYLQNDKLKEIGIHCFDGWAKTFGKVVNSIEIGVDGNSFRSRLRFNKFYNVAELMNIFREVAEILTKPMLEAELKNSILNRNNAIPPKHIGGKPKVVSIEPSEELETYMSDVVERTEAIHNGSVAPYEDNMLKITGDSKRASIDLRLVDEDFGHITNTKLDYVVREIKDIYTKYDSQKATQLVFCDFSAPNSDRFNVYDEIKNNLVELGVSSDEIAYIHDAKTELQKSVLFKKVNNGTVRILLGSTAKLGAGTNVQERLIAIHHVDVPWRASDVEQRNGRGFRQGNMFEEIYEIRYATTKSFDAYSWQMIETKSTYMRQLLEGSTTMREMVEDNDAILSYAEVKAIASGNPLIKEKLEVENRLKKLELLKQQYLKQKFTAEKEIKNIPALISKQERIMKSIYPDIAVSKANIYLESEIETKFSIQLFDKYFTNMKEAGDYLNERLLTFNKITTQEQVIGKFLNFDIGIKFEPDSGWRFYMLGVNKSYRGDTIHQVGRVNF
ncbi:MAG: helicase-related protein, partial [Dysgonomonas sp.]